MDGGHGASIDGDVSNSLTNGNGNNLTKDASLDMGSHLAQEPCVILEPQSNVKLTRSMKKRSRRKKKRENRDVNPEKGVSFTERYSQIEPAGNTVAARLESGLKGTLLESGSHVEAVNPKRTSSECESKQGMSTSSKRKRNRKRKSKWQRDRDRRNSSLPLSVCLNRESILAQPKEMHKGTDKSSDALGDSLQPIEDDGVKHISVGHSEKADAAGASETKINEEQKRELADSAQVLGNSFSKSPGSESASMGGKKKRKKKKLKLHSDASTNSSLPVNICLNNESRLAQPSGGESFSEEMCKGKEKNEGDNASGINSMSLRTKNASLIKMQDPHVELKHVLPENKYDTTFQRLEKGELADSARVLGDSFSKSPGSDPASMGGKKKRKKKKLKLHSDASTNSSLPLNICLNNESGLAPPGGGESFSEEMCKGKEKNEGDNASGINSMSPRTKNASLIEIQDPNVELEHVLPENKNDSTFQRLEKRELADSARVLGNSFSKSPGSEPASMGGKKKRKKKKLKLHDDARTNLSLLVNICLNNESGIAQPSGGDSYSEEMCKGKEKNEGDNASAINSMSLRAENASLIKIQDPHVELEHVLPENKDDITFQRPVKRKSAGSAQVLGNSFSKSPGSEPASMGGKRKKEKKKLKLQSDATINSSLPANICLNNESRLAQRRGGESFSEEMCKGKEKNEGDNVSDVNSMSGRTENASLVKIQDPHDELRHILPEDKDDITFQRLEKEKSSCSKMSKPSGALGDGLEAIKQDGWKHISVDHSEKAHAAVLSETKINKGRKRELAGLAQVLENPLPNVPGSEPASKEGKKKRKRKKLKEASTGNGLIHDNIHVEHLILEEKAQLVEITVQDISLGNSNLDKNLVENGRASNDVSAHGSSCKHIDQKAVEIETKMEELIPSPSNLTEQDISLGNSNLDKNPVENGRTSNDVSAHGSSCKQLDQKAVGIETKMEELIPSPSNLAVRKGDVAINVSQTLHSNLERVIVSHPKKKLLVLDLNGILVDVVRDPRPKRTPDIKISEKAVFKRPFCDDFLEFCFQRFNVGIWTSRVKKNVEKFVCFLMGESCRNLLFCWDQVHCTCTRYKTIEDKYKPLVLKELKKLWEKSDCKLPWEKGDYDESNTILLDDSPYKAIRNPPHTAIFPHPYSYMNAQDSSLGPSGDIRLYLQELAAAENVQKYIEQNPFGQPAITESSPYWSIYLKLTDRNS